MAALTAARLGPGISRGLVMKGMAEVVTLLLLALAISLIGTPRLARAAPGDLDCCGGVTVDDVGAFVIALTDPQVYASMFPGCDVTLADMNGDGVENGEDVSLFVDVLLTGDSSVQVTKCWDGGGDGNSWSDGANWKPNGVPNQADDMYILTGDVVMMDVGTASNPEEVASLTVHGLLDGTLLILQGKVLQINGDFTNLGATPDEHHGLVMQPDSSLTLVGNEADLIRVDVVMEAVAPAYQTTLTVGGVIEGGDFEVNSNCVVTVGQDNIPATSVLWGTWTISDGGAVTIKNVMGLSMGFPLSLTLDGGSTLTVLEGPYGTHTTFFSELDNKLILGMGNNVLAFGAADSDYPVFETGFSTVIKSTENSAPTSLRLEMFGGLVPHSVFVYDIVRENWDTRNVDIVALPIDDSVPFAWQIRYEMISTNLEDSYLGAPVIFLDIPCLGMWRDLILPEAGGINAALTSISEEYNNSYTDDFFEEPSFSAIAEAGLFRDVTVGAGRTLAFPTYTPSYGQVRLYCYGMRTIDENGTIIYWSPTGPLIVTHETDPSIDDLIVPAVGTIYGDWNGDCVITKQELDALLDKIAQGQYDPLFDFDCDGELSVEVEVAAFTVNLAAQPPC